MSSVVQWLFTINSIDTDERRRGRITIILAVVVLTLALVTVPIALQKQEASAPLGVLLFGIVSYIVTIFLVRSGRVTSGALLLIACLILPTCASLLPADANPTNAFFLILPLMVAGLTLAPAMVWVVLLAVLVSTFGVTYLAPASTALRLQIGAMPMLFPIVALQCTVAMMSFMGGRATAVALDEAVQARLAAEQAARQLERANTDLETHIAQRTTELQVALREVETRAAAQARLIEENAQQRQMIRELSVPVLPINANTLVMPLIGELDAQRLYDIQAQALEAIERTSARRLLLDITGVPIVDSQVAQGLMSVVQAAWLLGAEIMLVGIRPEVAQAIVGLGLSLDRVRTFSDIRTALDTARS